MNNTIAGNTGVGVWLTGAGTNGSTVNSNRIGVGSDGVSALGNTSHSVLVDAGASNNLIGGTAVGDGNIVAHSGGDGIRILGSGSDGDRILGNAIFANAGLGIDLGGDGPTPNDTDDSDSGPNALKNYPLLVTLVTDGSQVRITGTYNGVANTFFRLEFFANAAADPSGHGEGQRYLGLTTIKSNAAGDASFAIVLPAAVAGGEFVAATATDTNNRTSEFSPVAQALMRGVISTPTIGLVTSEAGAKAALAIKLAAPPTADVTIPLSISNPVEAKLSAASVTFTPLN